MGQRVLLFVFRTSAVVFVPAGLLLLGVWKLGGLVTDPAEDVWARAILEFLFRTGVTSLAAGILAPALLWAIRPASSAAVTGERRTSMGAGGMMSMMPPFLALVALLVMASSGPLLTLWKEGLALLESLEALEGGGAIASLVTSVLVLFLPVVGAATVLSFLSGTATAFAFRGTGRRFVRIYAAWTFIHAALVLTLVYSDGLLRGVSGTWVEELAALEAAGPDRDLPPEVLDDLKYWIPSTAAHTSSLATRAMWISLVYAAWLPLLLFAPGQHPGTSARDGRVRRWRAGAG